MAKAPDTPPVKATNERLPSAAKTGHVQRPSSQEDLLPQDAGTHDNRHGAQLELHRLTSSVSISQSKPPLDHTNVIGWLNRIQTDESVPRHLIKALKHLPKSLQRSIKLERGWKLLNDRQKRSISSYWQQRAKIDERKSNISRYIIGVKSLESLVATLGGASNSPLAAELAEAVKKVLSQANPDIALAKLADHLRAWNPDTDPLQGAGASTGSQLVLPNEAPAKYNGRGGTKASEFLALHYQCYIDAGVLTRPSLLALDRTLKQALDQEFKGRTHDYDRALPKRSSIRDDEIVAELGYLPATPEGRDRASRDLTRRKAASKPLAPR